MELTKEEKQLLLKDLCARLLYGVRVKIFDESILLEECNNEKGTLYGKETMSDDYFVIKCNSDSWIISCEDFKPYLRPMSSMTDEEQRTLDSMCNGVEMVSRLSGLKMFDKAFDYLNAHYLDYNGLIPMDLALEAPEDMYDL